MGNVNCCCKKPAHEIEFRSYRSITPSSQPPRLQNVSSEESSQGEYVNCEEEDDRGYVYPSEGSSQEYINCVASAGSSQDYCLNDVTSEDISEEYCNVDPAGVYRNVTIEARVDVHPFSIISESWSSISSSYTSSSQLPHQEKDTNDLFKDEDQDPPRTTRTRSHSLPCPDTVVINIPIMSVDDLCLPIRCSSHRRAYVEENEYAFTRSSQLLPPPWIPQISEKNTGISYGQICTRRSHKEEKVESLGCGAVYHSDDSQGTCESCAKVSDTNHWVLVEPELSIGKDLPTYSLNSPAGSYECSETGLRWSCAGPITLQYYDLQWELYCEEMANRHYKPAGPLMDIKLKSGELEEIHLPHSLCLGDCEASLHDAVRVLHGQDSGVCLEVCELTRHHAKLTHPSLSPLGLLLKTGIPIRVHCEQLLFKTCTSPLTLHAYLVPKERAALRAVEDQERSSGVKISKPKPERSLGMNSWFSMRTSCPSTITPEKIKLRYCSFSPNFFEVYFKQAKEAFEMELVCLETGMSVWRAEIRKNDYRQTSQEAISEGQNNDQCQTCGNHRDTSEKKKSDFCTAGSLRISGIERDDHYQTRGVDRNISEVAAFVDRHRVKLIRSVRNVMPIADVLLSKGLVHSEKYSEIKAAITPQAKMREIYECLRSAGAEGKATFYGVLLQEEPHLLQDLSTPAL